MELDRKIEEKRRRERRGGSENTESLMKRYTRGSWLPCSRIILELPPQGPEEGDSCSLIFPRKIGDRLNFDPSCDVSSDCYSRIITNGGYNRY